VEFTPLSWSPSDAQLLEARKYTIHEIALIFGLDPTWLGAAQTSRVYSNVEQEGINLVRYSVAGWLTRLEQALSAALPRGTYAKANTDAIMRADTLGRYQAHEIGIRSGFLTRDEARDLEERPPLTAGQRAELKPPAPAPTGEVPRLPNKRRPAA
jgi:HK97 family phage portal protein